jgi:hypothetical protein
MNLFREVGRRIFGMIRRSGLWHLLTFWLLGVTSWTYELILSKSYLSRLVDSCSTAKELALLVLELAFPPSSSCATVT